MSETPPVAAPQEAPLYGVLAEYNNPTALVHASKKVRDAGYSRWDTYTPFPIHGIERAMGIPMTRLPWFVLCAAITGLITAIWLQWWTNAVDYPWIVSGKPFWSWPANVPIWFELTILFSAFATLGGMLFLNNLPLPAHPLDLKERFRRASNDRFFLVVEASDPKFDEADTWKLLEETDPFSLDSVNEDNQSSDRVPRPLVYVLLLLAVASLIPFALFAKARSSKMDEGRLHVVWDMDFTPAYKAQDQNILFPDDRAMRVPPEGTVARGQLRVDSHTYSGKGAGEEWMTTLPKALKPTPAMMERGQKKYDVFCAPCHGFAGEGNGMVHQRASALQQGWVPPTNLHQDYLREQPAGQLFNTITHGIRNMPAYGDQIEPEDRWAIVLYLRALQKSRATDVKQLSAADRAQLK